MLRLRHKPLTPSSPRVKLGISWLVERQRVTDGGMDGDLWDWSTGRLVGHTDGIWKNDGVGWRLPTDDFVLLRDDCTDLWPMVVNLTLGRKQRNVVHSFFNFCEGELLPTNRFDVHCD
jgi:hypothetical protein